MRKSILLSVIILSSILLALPIMAAEETSPFAVVDSFSGDVKAGVVDSDNFAAIEPEMVLNEDQLLKTGPESQVTIRFTEDNLTAVVGENIEISLQDLLLKTRLETMRDKISPPAEDAQQTQMEVTPLTGVRGTEKSEEKAEEMKREHHWEENVEK